MRHRVFALLLALAGAPALAADAATPGIVTRDAGDELDTMNAVSDTWNRYAQLSSQDDPASVELLAASALAHHGFLRDATLYASTEQVRRLPYADRLSVYALRALVPTDELLAMDGAALAKQCTALGVCGIAPAGDGEPLLTLSHVTLIDEDEAVGEVGPPTGTQFQFGPHFRREGGQWRVAPEVMTLDASAHVAQQIAQAGVDENAVLQYVVDDLVDDARGAPPLAVLDRPLHDDADARARLNETWPPYSDVYVSRVAAMERKAAQGDALAMFGLGSLLYTGAMPDAAPQDRTRALALLEQASDAGHVQAAMAVLEAIHADADSHDGALLPPEVLVKAVRHTRRGAQGGVAGAMPVYGSFLFNGAGGLARDCVQAEEWSARAEDSGIEHARNDRVWYLATCPITAQRDARRALELAAHMVENAGTLSASELDTVAAAMAANARFDEAVDFQQRALAALDADTPRTRARMEQRLTRYQQHEDWVQDYNQYERDGP